jgi:uncharacterized repeat protein (TIGR04052 family)
LGTAGTVGKIRDLRFYVSGVALIDAAGNHAPLVLAENANQGRNVALLDFEDGTAGCSLGSTSTYTALVGKVAPGNYVGLAFTLGVPVLSADGSATVAPLNHSYSAQTLDNGSIKATPLPLQNAAMGWSWQSGRKFTKIEFTANAVAPAAGVTTMVHLGSTGCVGDPIQGRITSCASPNRPHVKFASFNPASQKIALDLHALFAGLDLSTSKTWMSGKQAATPALPATLTDTQLANNKVIAGFFNKFQLAETAGLPVNDGAAQTLFVVK